MIEIKKSVFFTIVISLGILFLIFLFVRIDGLNTAKKNYQSVCTETTWGTIVSYEFSSRTRGRLLSKETIKYTFEVNGRKIEGSYSARTFGGKSAWRYESGKQVLVHYNPNNVNQNYFGNHCEPVDKAETSLIIAIVHIVLLVIISLGMYVDQRRFWELEEDEKILRDFRRFS